MNNFKSLFNGDSGLFKCNLCEKYLSIPPILHNISVGFVCGRCCQKVNEKNDEKSNEDKEIFTRQHLYENVAKYLIFPCSYKSIGCQLELHWDKIQEHENACIFRNTICPFYEGNKEFLSLGDKDTCGWKDISRELRSHIVSKHKNHFKDFPHVNLGPNFQTVWFFVDVLHLTMFIVFHYIEDLEKYAVYVFTELSQIECDFYHYQVEVWKKSNPCSSVLFRHHGLEPLDDIIFKNKNVNSGLSMDFKLLKQSLGAGDTDSFIVKVNIVKKSNKEIKGLKSHLSPVKLLQMSSKRPYRAIDENMLQELECPVCNDYMIPPIYLCEAGHSVCGTCNSLVSCCPTCRSTMLNNRNYTLENLTSMVNYPCKNRSAGCFFVASSITIRNHEKNCWLSGRDCILKCSWKGTLLDMVVHLNAYHTVFKLDEMSTVLLGARRICQVEPVTYNEEVFLFIFSYGYDMTLNYDLQHLKYGDSQYKFKIELFDKTGHNMDITLQHRCSIFTVVTPSDPEKKKKKNKKHRSGYILPFNMFSSLLKDCKELDFKLTVSSYNN